MTFRYLRDPLFLICLGVYAVNRFAIKPFVHGGFAHTSLNDLICIPFWVPILLWLMRRFGLRTHDGEPTLAEIIMPLIAWSYWFEVLLPHAHLPMRNVGDPNDVLCYAIGAMTASFIWRWFYAPRDHE